MSDPYQNAANDVTAADNLQQGSLVQYEVDERYTYGNELFGLITAMVLPRGDVIRSNVKNFLVCPLIFDVDGPFLPEWDIAAPDREDSFFRPYYANSVGKSFLKPIHHDGKPVVMAADFVRQVCRKILDLTKSTMAENASSRFVGKGTMAWFNEVPYAEDYRHRTKTPAVCLTPLAVTERTGVAIMSRCYTDFNVYAPRNHVHVIGAPAYKPSFFNALNIISVSTSLLLRSSRVPPAKLLRTTMVEFHEKFSGTFDEQSYQAIRDKYPGKKGELPQDIKIALERAERGTRRPFTEGFRL